MAWNPNIPNPTDKLSQSQAEIKANFQALDDLVNGISAYSLFPIQGSSPTTSATQLAVFSRTSAVTSLNELCVRLPSNGVVTEFTAKANIANGWTRLASGMLVKWGSATALAGGQVTITYPTVPTAPQLSVPAFSGAPLVLISPLNSTAGADVDFAVRLIQSNILDFYIYVSARSTAGAYGAANAGITYIAIGM